MIKNDETIDTLFHKGFRLIQDRKGYRFSVDPLLLAYFAKIRSGDRIIDLGSGNGIIALLLGKVQPKAHLVAVEIQPRLADQALRNAIINGHLSRLAVLQEDLRNLPRLFRAGSFDVVVSNPPYRAEHSGRINPDPHLAKARHEIDTSLEDFISISAYLLRNGGQVYFMFPSSRLSELTTLLKKHHLEPKILQFLYPSASRESQHFLIGAGKNCRVGLRLLPPFILYQAKGIPSADFQAVYAFLGQRIGPIPEGIAFSLDHLRGNS